MTVSDEIEEICDEPSFSFCRSIPHSGLPNSKGFDIYIWLLLRFDKS